MPTSPTEDSKGLELTRLINMTQIRLRDDDGDGHFGDLESVKAKLTNFTTGPGSGHDSEIGELLRSMTPHATEIIPGWKIASLKMSIDKENYSFAVSNGVTTFSSSQDGVIYFETKGAEELTLDRARRYLELTPKRGWLSSLLVGVQQVGVVQAQGCDTCDIGESGCQLCCSCCGLECTTSQPPNQACVYDCGGANCGWCYSPKAGGGNCCSCLNQLCSCCL